MTTRSHGLRPTIWLWGGAGVLLLLPLLAMQVTGEFAWDAFDFFVAALLFGIVCGGVELASRSGRGAAFAGAAAYALLGGLLIVWANLAVGIVGDESDPVNLLFFGVVALGLVLAVISQFQPAGLARAMAATAAAQVCAAMAAAVLSGDPGAIYAALMAAPFLVSAWLFRRSA